MTNLIIHNLDDAIAQSLRLQAQQHGKTMEEEVQQILRSALAMPTSPAYGLGSKIAQRFAAVGGVELVPNPRSMPRHHLDLGDKN